MNDIEALARTIYGEARPRDEEDAEAIASVIRETFDYDPETGSFKWAVNRARAKRGEEAGYAWTHPPSGRRYRLVGLRVDARGPRMWRAHRLIFLWMTGRLPEGDVDHVNGDGLDNRWRNLREAKRSENSANSRRPRSNTSGFKGVNFHKRSQKYRATIRVEGRSIHLGLYESAEAAHDAYRAAAKQHFGEFARAA